MKRRSFTIGILCTIAIFVATFGVSAQKRTTGSPSPEVNSLRVEDFNYAPGQLTDSNGGANVSGGVWITNTGTGNFLQVTAGSLSYTGYPSSGVGNKLSVVSATTSSEDTFRNFPPQTSGTVYAAFMVNLTNATGLAANSSTTGDYFAGLIASNSTTNFSNRITIRAGTAADTFQIGYRATGNAGNTQVFSTTDLPINTTHLIVISYQIVAGATNDVCNLWVNPNITGPEPAATLSQVSAADGTDVGRFFIRQGAAGTPNASIDGIRIATSWAGLIANPLGTALDFNGDGRTDYAITRNSGGLKTWWGAINGSGASTATQWGLEFDKLAPADYDGDGKTDIAVWRDTQDQNKAYFYILQSSNGTFRLEQFGRINDQPSVVGDYDGDGKADVAVFRENGTATDPCGVGKAVFYYRPSGTPATNFTSVCWGAAGDIPTGGDFDGDGKFDFCVRRNSGGSGLFYLRRSGDGGTESFFWGLNTDAIAPGDYDGDGRYDFALGRINGTTGEFYILERDGGGTGAQPFTIGNINEANDYLAPGDYDGDGKTDLALWRGNADPTQNFFVVRRSSNGAFDFFEWGQLGDIPVGEWNITNND